MKKKYWYYIIGGIGVVTIGYYLYSMAKPKPKLTTGQTYLPEYRTSEDTLNVPISIKSIDLSQARNNEELVISAKGIYVLRATGKLEIKINDITSAPLDCSIIRKIETNIERLYLTNTTQQGCYVDLLINTGDSTSLDYAPVVPQVSIADSLEGYDLWRVNVTSSEQSYTFNFPKGVSVTKLLDILNIGDDIQVSLITPTGSLPYFTIPANTFYSVSTRVIGVKTKLTANSVSAYAEFKGWY
jgi:hypothetical protein